MEIRKAQRKQAKIKLALQGPSGSGKTYSALLLAAGMTEYSKIAVIDTENHSADLYAHLGDYSVLQLSQPFSPERYIEAIETCENAGMEVCITDSLSHCWDGSGGILDIHGNMAGNSFTNWSKLTPRFNALIQKILQSNCHVICTMRTKTDYTMTEKNGKMIPEKVGLKAIQREGVDYEFAIVLDLDIKHFATASKDRTGLFMDKPSFVITPKTGERILNWCNAGTSLDEVIKQVQQAKDVVELRDLLKLYPEYRPQIEPLAIKKKEELHAVIINQTKIGGNGIDKGKTTK
jgi:hypothetical protein